jgi:hypothetical protein
MEPSKLKVAVLLLAAMSLVACPGAQDDEEPVRVVSDPTHTDIWVAELLDSGRRLRVGTPVNVTDRAGYDNQPHFLPDGSGILYTTIDEQGQTDIMRFDFARERARRLTDTLEGEFSPTPLPDGGFAVVRVEADGRQRLWRFDADGRTATLLLAAPEPVGYMAWFDADTVAVFVLGVPPTLVAVDREDGASRELLRSIGRSLHPVPGERLVSTVHKVSDEEWNIVAVGLDDDEPRVLASALLPSEDFAWTPDGQLVMGRGSKLYIRRPGDGHEWVELADFTAAGVNQITRIAVSPQNDRIAIVGQR